MQRGGLFFSPSVQLFPCAVTTHCLHSSNKLILFHVAAGVRVNNKGEKRAKDINHDTLYLCPRHFYSFLQDLYVILTSDFTVFIACGSLWPTSEHTVCHTGQGFNMHCDSAGCYVLLINKSNAYFLCIHRSNNTQYWQVAKKNPLQPVCLNRIYIFQTLFVHFSLLGSYKMMTKDEL